jgi:benzoyl-CoA reductase/2-hydroxyglutaryl-CoA dehydratase subunit BcrC/BadD/HgdB
MMPAEKVVRKKFEAARVMGKFMAEYYLELDRASRTGEKKVAWCTSVGPAELLRGMGFLVYFPETHAAMLGATRTATECIPHANALGYSPEICSYLTSDIGAYVQGFSPLTRAYGIESIPKPDVLVFNTNQCRDVQDWFAWYAREFAAPVIGVHTYRGVEKVTESHTISIAKQMEDLIEPLEEVSGEKFDMDEFQRAVALSRECSDLWKKVLDTAAAVPSPLTFFDGTTLMGPAVVGRGTQAAVDYYKILLSGAD